MFVTRARLADDYFATIVTDFVATGQGARGPVGEAPGLVVDAAAMCTSAVRWIERAAP